MTARLLLVDDEKIALRNLEHVLAKEGHQVTATQSGSHALDLLDSQPFDLVLTDMKMDKVDGMQLLRRCKAQQPIEVKVPGTHCVLCITRLMRVVPSRMAGTIPAAQPNIARINSRDGIVQRMPDR